MTSKKLKKTFTAAFLSGSILLQNFPALAAASDTTDWLKESPFRQDITTEKSTQTESVPSETETVSPETLSTFQTEAETEIPEESKSSNNTASFLMADNSDTFSQILQEATLTPSYTFDSLNQDFSWKELKTELTRRINSYSSQVVCLSERPDHRKCDKHQRTCPGVRKPDQTLCDGSRNAGNPERQSGNE